LVNEGQKVRTVVGSFETPPSVIVFRPMPAFTNYAVWKEAWLKQGTYKLFCVTETDAKSITLGLKNQ